MSWKVSIEGISGKDFVIPVLKWILEKDGKATILSAQTFQEVMLLYVGKETIFPLGIYSEQRTRDLLEHYGLEEAPFIDGAWGILRKSKGVSPTKESCEKFKSHWESLIQ